MGGNTYQKRSYGQIAYDAYRSKSGGKSLISGQEIPSFDQLSEAIKEAWEAAGNAVHAACTESAPPPAPAREAFNDESE